MGNFYVNFVTRGPSREAIANSLWSAKRTAIVGPTFDGLTCFFDEESDSQHEGAIKTVAERTSRDLEAPVLAVLNHDDDVLAYWLFESGDLVDEYNSCPGYFDDGEQTPAGGDAKKLCAAFGATANVQQVSEILGSEEFVFAFKRHTDLAELLRLPMNHICMAYSDVRQLVPPNRPKDGEWLVID